MNSLIQAKKKKKLNFVISYSHWKYGLFPSNSFKISNSWSSLKKFQLPSPFICSLLNCFDECGMRVLKAKHLSRNKANDYDHDDNVNDFQLIYATLLQQKDKFDSNLLELEQAILTSIAAVAALPAPSAPSHEPQPWQAFNDEPNPMPSPNNTKSGSSCLTNGGRNQSNFVTAQFNSQVSNTAAPVWSHSSQRFGGGLEKKHNANQPSNWTGF